MTVEPCNCVDEINALLAQHNTRLEVAIIFGPHRNDGLMLRTEQIETGRGKPKARAMFLTYCPFCGQRYDDRPDPEAKPTGPYLAWENSPRQPENEPKKRPT